MTTARFSFQTRQMFAFYSIALVLTGIACGGNAGPSAGQGGGPPGGAPQAMPVEIVTLNRPDIRVFTAQRQANERIVHDRRLDWWPAASVNFGPQFLTPAGIFQPSRTWSLSVQLSQPIFEGGQRKGLRHQCEAIFQASTLSLEQAQIEARSEVRIARAAVEARERALASARASGADGQ